MIAGSMQELKGEVLLETKKQVEEVKKKLKAGEGGVEKKLNGFEDKLCEKVTEIISQAGVGQHKQQTPAAAPVGVEQRLEALESWGTPQVKQINTLIDKLEFLSGRVAKVEGYESNLKKEIQIEQREELEKHMSSLLPRIEELDTQIRVIMNSKPTSKPIGPGPGVDAVGEFGERVEQLEHEVFMKPNPNNPNHNNPNPNSSNPNSPNPNNPDPNPNWRSL